MATASYPVNDPNTVKVWSKRLDVDVIKETQFFDALGTGSNSLAQQMTELKKGDGDQITWGLRMLGNGTGVSEGEVLEGNEERATHYTDSLLINELRHGFRSKSPVTIDQQRVSFDLRQENYDLLRDWWAERLDTAFFNVLAGNTAQTDLKFTGFNAPLAPSANRVIRPAAVANDQSLTNSHPFTLNLIDKARQRAASSTPYIRPIKGMGRDVDYVCYVHPDQVYSLRADTTTAGNWFDLQKARLQGGEGDRSALITGAVGIYNRTLLIESTRIPLGVDSGTGLSISTVRRAVFCGAQAISVAFGKNNGPTKFDWKEKLFDYDNELGVKAGAIFGMKKSRYNGEDFGVITIPTYATA